MYRQLPPWRLCYHVCVTIDDKLYSVGPGKVKTNSKAEITAYDILGMCLILLPFKSRGEIL